MGRPAVRTKKVTRHGLDFPSKFQADCYTALLERLQRGEIVELEHEVVFKLEGQGIRIQELRWGGRETREYTADATYREVSNPDILIVEEAKGRMMGEASLRLSVFKALYPEHELRIVKQNAKRKRRKRRKKPK